MMPDQDDIDPRTNEISQGITAICELAVINLIHAMERFHTAWLSSETAINNEVPNQSESLEVSLVLLNIIHRDIEEIEAYIFPEISDFLSVNDNLRQIRDIFLSKTNANHRSLEGTMNAESN